jgi:hypothetical protein
MGCQAFLLGGFICCCEYATPTREAGAKATVVMFLGSEPWSPPESNIYSLMIPTKKAAVYRLEQGDSAPAPCTVAFLIKALLLQPQGMLVGYRRAQCVWCKQQMHQLCPNQGVH